MKKGAVSKSDAFYVAKADYVCGVNPAMAAVSGSTIFNSNVEVAIKFSKQPDYFRIEYDIFQSSKIVKFLGSSKKVYKIQLQLEWKLGFRLRFQS